MKEEKNIQLLVVWNWKKWKSLKDERAKVEYEDNVTKTNVGDFYFILFFKYIDDNKSCMQVLTTTRTLNHNLWGTAIVRSLWPRHISTIFKILTVAF